MKVQEKLFTILKELTDYEFGIFKWTKPQVNDDPVKWVAYSKAWPTVPCMWLTSKWTPTEIVECYNKYGIDSLSYDKQQIWVLNRDYNKKIQIIRTHKEYIRKCKRMIKKGWPNAQFALEEYMRKNNLDINGNFLGELK